MLPAEVEEVLSQYPEIRDKLDNDALSKLGRATLDRAVEILEEMAEKGDVRNPSAFVSIAVSKYPRKRGRASELEEAFDTHSEVLGLLDDNAIAKLREADPARASEILEDMAGKSDIRNPSAFVAKALSNYPHKRGATNVGGGQSQVHDALDGLPEDVLATLDEGAILKLKEVDPARAAEILGDLASKTDVRNPSAFVVKALRDHPQERGVSQGLDRILAQHPDVADGLDDRAMQMLQEADPARAVELVEDLIAKGDVRNPSAFISSGLNQFRFKRGQQATSYVPAMPPSNPYYRPSSMPAPPADPRFRAGGDPVLEQALRRHGHVADALDAVAMNRLREAHPVRAVEILEDLVYSGAVRNPSAFVMKALNDFPEPRGSECDLGKVLTRHPGLAAKLDEVAMQRLHEADPERAVEIIKEVASKGDVRNPSGFVCTALSKFPHKRGPGGGDYGGLPPPPPGGVAGHVRSILGAALGHPPPPPRQPRSFLGRSPLDRMLMTSPAARRLDDRATERLREADPERAMEILEDLDAKPDVRNPSAFVMKALGDHPFKRGRSGEDPYMQSRHPAPPSAKRPRLEGSGVDALDDAARARLDAADPDRAAEVLGELEMKGAEVRNPSAFVSRALQQYPHPRGRGS